MKIDSVEAVRPDPMQRWLALEAALATNAAAPSQAPSKPDRQFEQVLLQLIVQLLSQLSNHLSGDAPSQGGQGLPSTHDVAAAPPVNAPQGGALTGGASQGHGRGQAQGQAHVPGRPTSASVVAPAPGSAAHGGAFPDAHVGEATHAQGAGAPFAQSEPRSPPLRTTSADASPNGGSSSNGSVNGGGPNTVNLRNTTDKPMEVAFFRNLAVGTHPSFNGPEATFTLQPGETKEVAVPDDWQGRVQKWSGDTQNPSNWAEINFEQSTNKIWFNESDIPGRNSSVKITSGDGVVAGSDRSVLGAAPAGIVQTDSSGEKVIKPPQWFTGETNRGSVDYLNGALGTYNAYVLPDDNEAVRMSSSSSLDIDFGKA